MYPKIDKMHMKVISDMQNLRRPSYENWATLINFKLAPAGPQATGSLDYEQRTRQQYELKEFGQYVRKPKWSSTQDNRELQVSLRSVEMHLPWIRKIHVVSNGGATPHWLRTDHPRVQVVDADRLVARAGGRAPTFNSHALYLAMAFIEGLSEIFLQLDDDFILGDFLPPQFFFREYQFESSPVTWWAVRRDLPTHKQLLRGYSVRAGMHAPRTWNRTRIQEIIHAYPAEAAATLRSRFRRVALKATDTSDIDLTSFYAPYVHSVHGQPIYALTAAAAGEMPNTTNFAGSAIFIEWRAPDSFCRTEPVHDPRRELHAYKRLSQYFRGTFASGQAPVTTCLQDDTLRSDYYEGRRKFAYD